jgi:hypothetical protein
MLSRLFGNKNNLQLKRSGEAGYYFTRNHKFEAKDLNDSW